MVNETAEVKQDSANGCKASPSQGQDVTAGVAERQAQPEQESVKNDAQQQVGTAAPPSEAAVTTQQPSTTAQAPLRVSQRNQNAKKQARNEASDGAYKTKSKVSSWRGSEFKLTACCSF